MTQFVYRRGSGVKYPSTIMTTPFPKGMEILGGPAADYLSEEVARSVEDSLITCIYIYILYSILL